MTKYHNIISALLLQSDGLPIDFNTNILNRDGSVDKKLRTKGTLGTNSKSSTLFNVLDKSGDIKTFFRLRDITRVCLNERRGVVVVLTETINP